MPDRAVVCADIEIARAALDAGDDVVLVGPDADRLGLAAAALRGAGRRRVSVFVGDPVAGDVWAAAAAMAAEQYRLEVVIECPPPGPERDGGQVP